MTNNQLNRTKKIKLCDILMFVYLITINIELFEPRISAGLQNVAYLGFIFFAMFEMKLKIRASAYLMMYGSFFAFAFASVMWSVSSGGTMSLVRILLKVFVIATVAVSYYRTQESVDKVFQIIYYSLLFVILYVAIISPQSDWTNEYLGKSFGMDTVRYSVRAMLCASLGIYFYHSKKRLVYLVASFVCALLALLTGKRTCIIFLVVFIAVYFMILENTLLKRFRTVLAILGVIGVLIVLIYNVEILYNSIGIRIDSFIATLFGNADDDMSTINRTLLMQRSWESFIQSPIWGKGLNSQRAILESESFVQVTYAHNNMLEIASGLGIIGVVLYYNLFFSSMKKGFRILKTRKVPELAMLVALFITYFVCDFVQVIYESYFENMMLAFMVTGVYAYSCRNEQNSNIEKAANV